VRFSQPLSGSLRAGWHSADYIGQEAQARAAQRGVHAHERSSHAGAHHGGTRIHDDQKKNPGF
jgi:hypothetical protein